MPDELRRPNLWTIPPSAPFLETLAEAMIEGSLFPEAGKVHPLSDHLVLLPTRRACRALTDIFVERTSETPMLLPRIRPIGDVDETEIALDSDPGPSAGEEELSIPPAVPPLRRHVLLTRLVLGWGRSVAQTLMVPGREEPVAIPVRPGEAAFLARDLAGLLDDFETEGQSLDALRRLVPDDHADYWRITLEFLKIISVEWPAILAAEGVVDPATRRDRLLRVEGDRLRRNPPPGPVIAAGSTGSIPATAALLATIARLPRGAVVLPGLDMALDEESWTEIDAPESPQPGHPQFGLKRLIAAAGTTREGVDVLGGARGLARESIVSETFRPVSTTERWADLAGRLDGAELRKALDTVAVVEAAGEQEEATAIALILREAAETRQRRAALVTPDRGLARRVSAELRRWNLEIDDSAGVPLAETPPGVLFRLIADAAAASLSPLPLVSLLQHPLAGFGFDRAEARRAARALELIALRGPRPGPGSAGLLRVVEHALQRDGSERLHPAVGRADGEASHALARVIAAAFAPLEALGGVGEVPLAQILGAHQAVLAAVSRQADGASSALEGEAGLALSEFLAELAEAADAGLDLTLSDYPVFLGVLMTGRPVRPKRPAHPRLSILGPLEARLLSADLIVLGGLNEGTWPAETRTDAFLNRPMRGEAGLQAPERFIGLAAHDVANLICAPSVVLTRSGKTGGEPTVPSRWLQRLKAVIGSEHYDQLRARGDKYCHWARGIDLSDTREAITEPLPRPAAELRPTRLSVTDIEKLIRDPYEIYARRVLRLNPLEPLDSAPDAATRGTLIHDALDKLDAAIKAGEDGDLVAKLIQIGEELFSQLDDFPEVKAVWWPRFLRVARWFVPKDLKLRTDVAQTICEASGELQLQIGGRAFTLRGRADRIDVMVSGALRIIDYKTGAAPGHREVMTGLAPQLPLEAAMARAGAFADVPAERQTDELVYITLKGGNPAGEYCPVQLKDMTAGELADETLASLQQLLTRFADANEPYRAKVRPKFLRTGGDYDHLSRFAEWGAPGAGEEPS